MGDTSANEYNRAQKDENDLFAAIGKKVLGLKLDEEEENPEENEDERVKIVDEIESYCVNCEENGVTRLLLTKIPFFREVILSSFYCDHCKFANNEIQAAGQIQEQGSKYIFKLDSPDDLQRQVVKSDTSVFRIEELDFEVPAGRGRLTNVEGIISTLLQNLEDGQTEERKETQTDYYNQIENLAVQPLTKLLNGNNFPCTISLNDPAGNSWIEPSSTDSSTQGKYVHQEYPRTPEQNRNLGLGETDAKEDGGGMEDVEILEGKTYDLPTSCPGCTKIAQLLIQKVNIPHFQEVILMNTSCNECGYQTKDVKTGGEVSAKGKRIWLEVKSTKDLRRDILKSESCLLKIPDFELSVEPGTMGGKFTTLEGLLTQLRDDLKSTVYDIGEEATPSDSMVETDKQKWAKFFAQLDKAIAVEISYTVVMEDPLANSYCQNFDVPGPGNDPQLRIEEYDRTEEEENDLGLADMKTKLDENGEYVRDTFEKQNGNLNEAPERTNGTHQAAEK